MQYCRCLGSHSSPRVRGSVPDIQTIIIIHFQVFQAQSLVQFKLTDFSGSISFNDVWMIDDPMCLVDDKLSHLQKTHTSTRLRLKTHLKYNLLHIERSTESGTIPISILLHINKNKKMKEVRSQCPPSVYDRCF